MHAARKSPDTAHLVGSSKPTRDALLVALLEQQKLIDRQRSDAAQLADEARSQADIIEKKSSVIANQKARIDVLQELLAQGTLHRFGASSEKNVLQSDLLFDEAELLADGAPDPDDGELADPADDEAAEPERSKPRRPGRRGFSANLPRVQEHWLLSDEEREGAIDTFFV